MFSPEVRFGLKNRSERRQERVQILTCKLEFSHDEFSCLPRCEIFPGGVQRRMTILRRKSENLLQEATLATPSNSDFS